MSASKKLWITGSSAKEQRSDEGLGAESLQCGAFHREEESWSLLPIPLSHEAEAAPFAPGGPGALTSDSCCSLRWHRYSES